MLQKICRPFLESACVADENGRLVNMSLILGPSGRGDQVDGEIVNFNHRLVNDGAQQHSVQEKPKGSSKRTMYCTISCPWVGMLFKLR
jgi:hypothetical protein